MVLRRSAVTVVLGASLLALAAVPATAQYVRVLGTVQWISSTTMQMMTEMGSSILVDLMQVDQASYRGLRTGDWVFIEGVLSGDRRRLVAQTVWRDSGRGSWTQSP